MSFFMSSLAVFALFFVAYGKDFLRGNHEQQLAPVDNELNWVISDVLGHGHGVDTDALTKIRSALAPLVRTLPKNKKGKLSAAVMRYAVQRYFSQRRGWIMKGFEPHAGEMNASAFTDGAHILQGKLPSFVRTVLEQKLSHDGFALEDTAVIVASLERLILDEVVRGVETALGLCSRVATEGLNRDALLDVLSSYLILEMVGGSGDNARDHTVEKEHIREIYPHWDETFQFLLDVAENDIFEHASTRSPFAEHGFGFEDVVRISQRVNEEFGPWSNHECLAMKSALASKDTHDTGRIKLSDFYRKSMGSAWQFKEASEYLRQVGALDESSTLLGAHVIIPNYIAGMNNCITSTPYFSICCLNECDSVYQYFEKVISSTHASVADIVVAFEGMPEGKEVSKALRDRLGEIASLHGGNVPLHGRLFAQWLHYALPRDCPYPHMSGITKPQTQAQFEEAAGEGSTAASDEEIAEFIKAEAAHLAPSPEAGLKMWNLHEVVLDVGDDEEPGTARAVLRLVALAGMLGGLVTFVRSSLAHVREILHSETKTAKDFVV